MDKETLRRKLDAWVEYQNKVHPVLLNVPEDALHDLVDDLYGSLAMREQASTTLGFFHCRRDTKEFEWHEIVGTRLPRRGEKYWIFGAGKADCVEANSDHEAKYDSPMLVVRPYTALEGWRFTREIHEVHTLDITDTTCRVVIMLPDGSAKKCYGQWLGRPILERAAPAPKRYRAVLVDEGKDAREHDAQGMVYNGHWLRLESVEEITDG